MTITLIVTEEHVKLAGAETFEVPAGKTLKIETSPRGEEYLNETVPEGKVWEVSIYVDIKEMDA
jgi:hypothetical protein